MPRKKIRFQDQFPGLTVDSLQQKHLMRLAATYAGYKRDVSSLTWLLHVQNLPITHDDKIKLRYGWADASIKLDFVADLIGNDAMAHMVCPVLDSSTLSAELNLCGEPIAPVYEKYRRAYFSQQLNNWVDLYKLSDSIIINWALNEPRLRTPADKLAQYSIMEIRSNIKEYARALGRNPANIFRSIRDQKFTESLNADKNKLKAAQEQTIAKNAQKIAVLLRQIEDAVSVINSLPLSVRPSLDLVESLHRDMAAFKEITGYALADWYQQNRVVPTPEQKQR